MWEKNVVCYILNNDMTPYIVKKIDRIPYFLTNTLIRIFWQPIIAFDNFSTKTDKSNADHETKIYYSQYLL